MGKDKLLRMIKEVIFEKVGEFNGLNHPESITNNDELGADMALDSLDFVEVVMEMEKRLVDIYLMKCLMSSLIAN